VGGRRGWLPRLFLSLSILIVVAAWIGMENFGGILTGSSTDIGRNARSAGW
jgi:hypothetical protein